MDEENSAFKDANKIVSQKQSLQRLTQIFRKATQRDSTSISKSKAQSPKFGIN